MADDVEFDGIDDGLSNNDGSEPPRNGQRMIPLKRHSKLRGMRNAIITKRGVQYRACQDDIFVDLE